jgi:PPK2 family polyphosphate:nucleotide phosphotransferase
MKTKPSIIATPGKRFRLKDFDPAYKGEYKTEEHAQAKLENNKECLAKYQDLLFSARTHALLIVLQAMDAAGKDGTIKHVMSGVNPAGCQVFSFKQPSAEELGHDFLWRTSRELPERGRIGIFNRSYYEDVLVVRVHPELIAQEHLPNFKGSDRKFWEHRFESINDIERHLVRNGTVILKFFLNVSKQEQVKRLLERLDDPKKNWKFSEADLHERLLWDDYMLAYEDMIDHTTTKHAPWYIIPADHKWFTHLTVSDIIVEILKGLKLEYPSLTGEQAAQLAKARAALRKRK